MRDDFRPGDSHARSIQLLLWDAPPIPVYDEIRRRAAAHGTTGFGGLAPLIAGIADRSIFRYRRSGKCEIRTTRDDTTGCLCPVGDTLCTEQCITRLSYRKRREIPDVPVLRIARSSLTASSYTAVLDMGGESPIIKCHSLKSTLVSYE